jgi:hypothetical protein
MRFQIAGSSSAGKQLLVDNFQVVFTSSSVGGSGAFSLAKESASLTVLAMNNPPVASNQSITTPGGAPSVITLTGSDTENSPLIFSVLSGPTNGVLSAINATNGTLTYTPKSGYAGPDSFTFAANDGLTNSSAALVSITVTPVAPTILTQPISQTVMAGQSAVFSVAAAGTAPMGYQWKRNGSPVAGATNSALLLNPVQMTDAGTYAVVVSNLAGSATSAAAALTVVPPPTLGAAAMTSNGFRFQLSATVGYTYVTLASTNLHDWSPIATNVATSNSVVVTDPLATRCAGRFYRVARTN